MKNQQKLEVVSNVGDVNSTVITKIYKDDNELFSDLTNLMFNKAYTTDKLIDYIIEVKDLSFSQAEKMLKVFLNRLNTKFNCDTEDIAIRNSRLLLGLLQNAYERNDLKIALETIKELNKISGLHNTYQQKTTDFREKTIFNE